MNNLQKTDVYLQSLDQRGCTTSDGPEQILGLEPGFFYVLIIPSSSATFDLKQTGLSFF